MAVITRSVHPSLLWPGVHSIFGDAYDEYPAEWSQIFDKQTSNKAWEDLVEVGGFGIAPVKTEGAPIQYDVDSEGYKARLTHTVYGLGYMVTREELEDGQYAQVSRRRSRKLARSMRTTAEIVHANILNRGFSGSYLGGDGVSLFSTAHPTLAGNQANKPAVDADLTEASLEDMLTLISQFKDRRGLPIRQRGVKLVVAPGGEFNARRILGSPLRVGTANNDLNAIKDMGLVPGGVIVNHYLTDPDAWFLITDVDDGLVSMWRREVEFEQDNDFDTQNAKAMSTMRFLAGWGDWRGIVGTQGA